MDAADLLSGPDVDHDPELTRVLAMSMQDADHEFPPSPARDGGGDVTMADAGGADVDEVVDGEAGGALKPSAPKVRDCWVGRTLDEP